MKAFLAFLFTFLIYSHFVNGQGGLNLPDENPDLAKEKYAILSDYHDSENPSECKMAYASLQWIINNSPGLHESVYIFGVKLLKTMIAMDPENPDLKDDLMKLYDLRIEYFGNELDVLDRKAYDAFQYLRKDTSRLDEIVSIFDYLYQKEKENLATNLIYPYFMLKINQLTTGKINNQELIKNYQNITEIMQSKLDHADSNMLKIQKLIDANFVRYVHLSCDSIDNLLDYDDQANLMSIQQAQMIIKLSLAFECTDKPIFIEAVKRMYDEKPTLKLAKLIGGYYLGKKEYSMAIDFFNQAVQLAENNPDKAEIYFDLAKTYYVAKNYIKAREMASLSLQYNRDNPDCYILIGDMYYNSFDECKRGISHVKDRSIFYAAYEKYALAGDIGKMSNAEQQFPTMEQIHTENFREDEVINTGCWVEEEVTIRRRPNLAIK